MSLLTRRIKNQLKSLDCDVDDDDSSSKRMRAQQPQDIKNKFLHYKHHN